MLVAASVLECKENLTGGTRRPCQRGRTSTGLKQGSDFSIPVVKGEKQGCQKWRDGRLNHLSDPDKIKSTRKKTSEQHTVKAQLPHPNSPSCSAIIVF